MSLGATIHTFAIDLADADRGVYESLDLRVARHPSESDDYLVTRVLACALEWTDGIAFTTGLASPDEPAIAVRDLTGTLRAWIEVGLPDAARLHKAAKAAPRVAVYSHRDVGQMLRKLAGARIHRAEAIELWAIGRPFLDALTARLARRMAFSLSVTDRELYLSIGTETLTGVVRRHPLV